MRCLLNGHWVDSSLDYHRPEDAYRIRVRGFANIEAVEDAYFILPRSAKLVWNYLREVGLLETWRKIMSRMQEHNRNEKFQSVGIGSIIAGPHGGRFSTGDPVVFFAPGFPACVERIVLPEIFLADADSEGIRVFEENAILYHRSVGADLSDLPWWTTLRSWSPYSGTLIPDELSDGITKALHWIIDRIDWGSAIRLPQPNPTPMREVRTTLGTFAAPGGKRKRAVLFGYGHYAKTNILPNVRDSVDVEAVHEVDPAQIPEDWGGIRYWDSSPSARPTEDYDVYFIAGYHHTHSPLACTALRRGSHAVVEKPIAVDRAQLADLLDAIEDTDAGFFACFHKRYSPFNPYVWQDLDCMSGEPVNYHCIVYEVPLPKYHWYRWPNSKSRLISNGCHWLDHFLYLNRFCEVESTFVEQASDASINCSVKLVNGACFSMVLTDCGSQRIGLQDYIELRARGATAKIVNNSHYFSEDSMNVLRRTRIKKTAPYRQMYRSIAKRIATEDRGDSLQSVRVSTALILDLEDSLDSRVGSRES